MDDLYNFFTSIDINGSSAIPSELLLAPLYFPIKVIQDGSEERVQHSVKKGSVFLRQNGDPRLEKIQPSELLGTPELGPGDFFGTIAYDSIEALEKQLRPLYESGDLTEVQDVDQSNLYKFQTNSIYHEDGLIVYSENRAFCLDPLDVLHFRHVCPQIPYEYVPVQFRNNEYVRSLQKQYSQTKQSLISKINSALEVFNWIERVETYSLASRDLGNQAESLNLLMVDITSNGPAISSFEYKMRLYEAIKSLVNIVPKLGVTLDAQVLELTTPFRLPPPALP